MIFLWHSRRKRQRRLPYHLSFLYEVQIQRAKDMIKNADAVIIGAGAGASTAAGICYGGKRFTDNFAEFIDKYGKASYT